METKKSKKRDLYSLFCKLCTEGAIYRNENKLNVYDYRIEEIAEYTILNKVGL